MARTSHGAGLAAENTQKDEKPPKDAVKVETPQTGVWHQTEQLLRISCGCTMKELESLMAGFLSELEPNLSLANKTPEKAMEEKRLIKQRLIFFNSAYREIPEPKRNFEYMSKMSNLLAHYIGLEVLTSADPFNPDGREGKDLMSRIVTTLYLSLDSSEDYVLDTMMKLRAPFENDTTKKDVAVYSELFKFVVKKARKRQINDLTYMRYVLVYRLWKKMIKEDVKMKETVIKTAAERLRPPPKFVQRRSALPQVLPVPPKKTGNITEFFMREKYNVRRTVKKFLDETSEAIHQTNMFINLSCDPRLLNPKIRDPLPTLDSPIQEFSTFMSTADDVWQRLHEEPHSESSIFEQVTNLKKIPTCTPTRMFNLLHSHHLQHKARKAEKKKAASRKPCFRSRPLVGGMISSRRMNGLPDRYGPSISNSSDPVSNDPPVRKPVKRRALESPDVRCKKAVYENGSIPHCVEGGSRRNEKGRCEPWSSPSKSLERPAETDSRENKKIPDAAGVKSEVKEEPGSSCDSAQSFGDPDSPGKLAIEKEVEKTLAMLQNSKPVFETPVKAEDEPTPVENSNPVRTPPGVVPDWNAMWGAPMSYLNQPQELDAGDNVWMDELLSYLPEIADYS